LSYNLGGEQTSDGLGSEGVAVGATVGGRRGLSGHLAQPRRPPPATAPPPPAPSLPPGPAHPSLEVRQRRSRFLPSLKPLFRSGESGAALPGFALMFGTMISIGVDQTSTPSLAQSPLTSVVRFSGRSSIFWGKTLFVLNL
jgi:hypothetical protein